MTRIPLVDKDLQEPRELVAAVRERRGGHFLELDRLLLHSPELASGWNFFLGKVRQRLGLDERLRELAICAVAGINGAEYEFVHHSPLLEKAGATPAQIKALHDPAAALKVPGLFDEKETAVLRMTLEMTRDVKVSDATFAEARKQLGSDRLIVELTGVVGAYNMVSRFLVALHLEP